MPARLSISLTSSAAAALTTPPAAQPCTPGWYSVDQGPDFGVYALAVFQEGSRSSLFAGGNFGSAGGVPSPAIARWDGAAWSAVGDVRFDNIIRAMIVFDDGSGPALYVGGALRPVPGFASYCVARWDGVQWTEVGDGLGGPGAFSAVLCFAVHDDGAGPSLYAGGQFWIPPYGQQDPRNIAKWTGQSWEPVGGGTSVDGGTVQSMISFDDGAGPSLFVAGFFTSPPRYLVRWDGSQWHDARGSWDGAVGRFVVFDDGNDASLYVAGSFSNIGGLILTGLMKWDGSDWAPVGVTNNSPHSANSPRSVLAWDDGAGPALYMGGSFSFVNGEPIRILARWDGAVWSGTGAQALYEGTADALAAFDDGSGPALYAGGIFNIHAPTRYLVRYYTCNHPGPCYPNCDVSTTPPTLNVDDFLCFINEFAAAHPLPHQQQLESYANCDDSTTPPVLNIDDFHCFINAFAQGCP